MLKADNITIQIGERILLNNFSTLIQKGDKIGLIGRNGAGKTTLFKTLAGKNMPDAGSVSCKSIGYLPQDPSETSNDQTVIDRVLSIKGLDTVSKKLDKAILDMASTDEKIAQEAANSYDKLERRFLSLGGWEARHDGQKILSSLGLLQKHFDQKLKNLSGGQRRRVELARILFSDADILLLDEPTNHLDSDSVQWLLNFLKNYEGGVLIITHNTDLLKAIANKIFYFDILTKTIDQYNLSYEKYLKQREKDAERKRTMRKIAMEEATRLLKQGNKMRAKANKAVAAQQMLKRAEELLSKMPKEEKRQKVASFDFPKPDVCGKTPISAVGLSKTYGSLEVFTDVSLVIDKGSKVVILGLNGAGKTTLLKILAGVIESDTGQIIKDDRLKIGYYAQEHETLDHNKTVLENMEEKSKNLDDLAIRGILGAFFFSGDNVYKKVSVLSGGEKTRLALAILVSSGANVLLLDEPTNNLDPLSREEILESIKKYQGATILVTHDPGCTKALNPDRVLLLPDASEDMWKEEYQELVELA